MDFSKQRAMVLNQIADRKAAMMDALKAKEAADEQYKRAELDLYGAYGALNALESIEKDAVKT